MVARHDSLIHHPLDLDALAAEGLDRHLAADLQLRPPGYPVEAILDIRRRFQARLRLPPEHRDHMPNWREDREQIAYVSVAKGRERKWGVDLMLHHSPNQEKRRETAVKQKKLGVSPGFPDLIHQRPPIIEGVRFGGLADELKRTRWKFRGVAGLEAAIARAAARGKRNRTAERELAQHRWLERQRDYAGWIAEFVRGCFEALLFQELCYGPPEVPA